MSNDKNVNGDADLESQISILSHIILDLRLMHERQLRRAIDSNLPQMADNLQKELDTLKARRTS